MIHTFVQTYLVERSTRERQKTKMNWKFKEEHLDLILVPGGLMIMLCYHLLLLYKCKRYPKKTTIGFENHSSKIWVNKMMQVDVKDRGSAFSVIGSNISAATYLASVTLAITSLIGTWIGSTSNNQIVSRFIYGDKTISISAIKYVCIIVFFLLAFVSFVQAARCLVHANFLLSMPQADVPPEFVREAVIRGHNFWQLGLRAIYFATNFLMWVFGPIPMFASSVVTVFILCVIDANKNPLHDFPNPLNQSKPKKVGQERTSVAMAVEHNER
ncbi:hypothetical protein V2J09_017149 [Rumex salicifolius]